MNFLVPFIGAFCFRSGGVGKDDRFLPFMNPPTPWANKWWRWSMGVWVALAMWNLIFILTYFLVTWACPYGEKSWMAKIFGPYRFFVYGVLLGAASLSWGMALWMGCLLSLLKFYDIDWAISELLIGFFATLWVVFK